MINNKSLHRSAIVISEFRQRVWHMATVLQRKHASILSSLAHDEVTQVVLQFCSLHRKVVAPRMKEYHEIAWLEMMKVVLKERDATC